MNTAWMQLCAGAFGFVAVALGAFAAHGLKSKLDAYALDIMATATQYLLLHAAVLLALSAIPSGRWTNLAALALATGALLFSGSLYALAFSGIKGLGAITPIGGLLLLMGWGLVIVAAYTRLAGR